jgi:hypothetical protein
MTDLLVSDTPIPIRKKQIEIILAKSNEVRLRQCFEMIDFSYQQSKNLLKKKLNLLEDQEVNIAYIEASYKSEINEQMLQIIKSKNQ